MAVPKKKRSKSRNLIRFYKNNLNYNEQFFNNYCLFCLNNNILSLVSYNEFCKVCRNVFYNNNLNYYYKNRIKKKNIKNEFFNSKKYSNLFFNSIQVFNKNVKKLFIN